MRAVVVALLMCAAAVAAQELPSEPKTWPRGWVMHGSYSGQCSEEGVSARSYVMYNSGSQARVDLNEIGGMSQNMTYLDFDFSVNTNRTAKQFANANYLKNAKCRKLDMGSSGSQALPAEPFQRTWTSGAKWIGQTNVGEEQVNVWMGTNFASWWASMLGCPSKENVFYVLYEQVGGLRHPLQLDIIMGDPKPNWMPQETLMEIELSRELGLRLPATAVFDFEAMIENYC